jgi:hypothetical protein
MVSQAVNMIECPELRSLFLFMCPQLRENGLIHRTALTQKIKETYQAVHLDNITTFFKVKTCHIHILSFESHYYLRIVSERCRYRWTCGPIGIAIPSLQ